MDILFIIPCMSDLRYIIPFARAMKALLPEVNQFVDIQRWSAKYNGLLHNENYEKCVLLTHRYCPWFNSYDGRRVDYAVVVETCTRPNCEKLVSIQHGFDCAFLAKDLQCVDMYICGSRLTAEFAVQHGVPNVVVSPFPVPFWKYDDALLDDNHITVLYPDSGDNDLASKSVQHILDQGFNVTVKQRKKHQIIRSAGKHVYDEIWYPPEAIELPLMSRFTLAFGSTAYTDLVAAGVNYINIDIHHALWPWNVFVHPIAPCYVRVLQESDVIPAIDDAINRFRCVKLRIDDEQLHLFLLKLFHE